MQSHMLACGITENSKPRERVMIRLPVQIQRENGTWVKKAVKKPDGTRIALLEFKAYQECLIINDADTKINFD